MQMGVCMCVCVFPFKYKYLKFYQFFYFIIYSSNIFKTCLLLLIYSNMIIK